jgi:hypothetical protein
MQLNPNHNYGISYPLSISAKNQVLISTVNKDAASGGKVGDIFWKTVGTAAPCCAIFLTSVGG